MPFETQGSEAQDTPEILSKETPDEDLAEWIGRRDEEVREAQESHELTPAERERAEANAERIRNAKANRAAREAEEAAEEDTADGGR